MKKLFLILMLLITSVPFAQSYKGIKDFPSMTVFSLESKDGQAYYVRLDDSKAKAVNSLGEFKLYDKNGKKVRQYIKAMTIDDDGVVWFVNNYKNFALYKMDGSQFTGEKDTKLKADFVGYLGLKNCSDKITGLVFKDGVLYGITYASGKIYSIDTKTGEAKLVSQLKEKFHVSALVNVKDEFYLIKSSCSWRGNDQIWKFDSFPEGNVSYVATIKSCSMIRTATGHPNGYIYAATANYWFKVEPVNLKAKVILHFCSGIGGMSFFLPNEGSQTQDKNFADLALTGSVDNSHPKNGDKVHFTFKLVNKGPDKATNIVVKNTLQEGLDFISADAEKGDVKDSSNVLTWEIPELKVNDALTMKVTAQLNIKDANKAIFDLGPAKGYNVFVINDADSLTSDTEGKMFVGGYARLGKSYSVGYKLRNDSLNQAVLVVGHTLEYGPSGAIYGGDVIFGRDTIFYDFNPATDIVNGTLIKDLKFVKKIKKKTYLLKQLSARLYKYTPNGKTTLDYSTLRLNGSNPFLNVFSVEESQVESATDFIINVPNGSVVLVNFKDKYSDKDTLHWGGGLKVYGADYSNVIFNFYKTKNLEISGINVTGTILAPKTNVNFVNGQQNGQMIAYNLEGAAQYNNTLFVGNLPFDSTLYSIAEVVAVDQVDTNSTPDNGVATEDDFVSLAVDYNSRGASSGSGQTTFKWELVGKFQNDELVWTMEPEKTGSFLIGTWGGKIYRLDSTDTWTLLNKDGMDGVSYIWSIKILPDGRILVGTEKGVFFSDDGGKTWQQTSFTEGDVRSLAYYEKTVYAGTWGNGLYKSTDEGKTWKKVDNSISKAAVVGLVTNDKGELFIGTFDVGLYKSTDGGKTVTQLNIEYPYIWTLGKADNGVIYAGTYGNGLYSSADDGETWGRENAVDANYIYAVRTKDKRIYATSWESGVFTGVIKSAPANSQMPKAASGYTVDWYDMGLSGFGVSSVLPTNDGKYVYAGTSKGEIYRTDATITSVNNSGIIPSELTLEQNYPNPFNPTTTIKYEIPKTGFVKLVVYDLLGRKVTTLAEGKVSAGIHSVVFDAADLPSGVYFYRLSFGNASIVKKMILLK